MAGVLLDEEGSESLKSIGVKDSKLLSIVKMRTLFDKIKTIAIKWKIVVIEPSEIDAALQSDDLNLNWLEAHKSAEIINSLKPQKAIIDSPSNNIINYKRYLMKLLDNKEIDVSVEHKADLNHIECGAASILAKVTREDEIGKIKKKIGINFGSGYLTDPLTQAFLKKNHETHHEIFRKSWMPYKRVKGGEFQKDLSGWDEN
ncbi:ribonuclease HII [Candidatus Woesearchaeota archaeon]|nr:ribonuclease HII [Candidatus Woesearchaeota archaeon]